MTKYLVTFLTAALLSFLLTPLIRMLSRKIEAMDLPGERKVHQRPMPGAGGVAIFLAFTLPDGGKNTYIYYKADKVKLLFDFFYLRKNGILNREMAEELKFDF